MPASQLEISLANQKHAVAAKLNPVLNQELRSFLPKITSGIEKGQLDTISAEIATESSSHILEDIGKIVRPEQINFLAADIITQSIISHPLLENKIKTQETKLYDTIRKQTERIFERLSPELQKTAVLSKINSILRRPDQEAGDLIDTTVKDSVTAQSPLIEAEKISAVQQEAHLFVDTYRTHFSQEIASHTQAGKTPTFNELEKAQDSAFSVASARAQQVAKYDLNNRIGFILGLKPTEAEIEAGGLGIAQPNTFTFSRKVGFARKGVGLSFNTGKGQLEAYYSLLAHDKNKLNKAILEATQTVDKLKSKKSRSYKENKSFLQNQKKLRILLDARDFSITQKRRSQTYLNFFRGLATPKGQSGVAWASQNAWNTTHAMFNGRPGIYSPQSLVGSKFIASRYFGGMSFQLGDYISLIKKPQMIGMGKSLSAKAGGGLIAANVAAKIMKDITKAGVVLFGALALYFMHLGAAAVTGFMVGAAIGGTAGALVGGTIGFQIGVALAPFTFGLSIPVFTALGALGGAAIGAAVGGFAGGAIGYGLASGSTTAVTTGVGAGVGGTAGAVAGGTLGATIGALGGPFAPITVPLGAFIGASIGAVLGAAVGGAIGYGIGQVIGKIGLTGTGAGTGAVIGFYVGGPIGAFVGASIGYLVTGGWAQIKSLLSSGVSGAAVGSVGLFSSISGFFTGAASTITGFSGGLFGGAIGLVSGAGNLFGSLGALTLPASVAAVPVFGTVGAITVGSIFVGVVTATSFFTPDQDTQILQTGDNEYFTITKNVTNPQDKTLEQSDLPYEIKFEITLSAKVDLTSIIIVDTFEVKGDKNTTGEVFLTSCPAIPNILPAGSNWTCSDLTISAENDWNNSIVINSVSASVVPSSQTSPITDKATDTVRIGEIAAGCPVGWPVIGQVSQGPDGGFSHDNIAFGPGYEAIDIAQGIGNPVFATVDGIVVYGTDRSLEDQRLGIAPFNCPGLDIVWYWHLSAKNVADGSSVTWGTQIGESGAYEGAAHVHYQFNNPGDRSFPILPFVEPSIERNCDGIPDCNFTITSAP